MAVPGREWCSHLMVLRGLCRIDPFPDFSVDIGFFIEMKLSCRNLLMTVCVNCLWRLIVWVQLFEFFTLTKSMATVRLQLSCNFWSVINSKALDCPNRFIVHRIIVAGVFNALVYVIVVMHLALTAVTLSLFDIIWCIFKIDPTQFWVFS